MAGEPPGRAAPERPAPRLVLASSSPRRLDLLRQVGLEPNAVLSTEIDERPLRAELPRDLARRLARAKAAAALTLPAGREGRPVYLLAADTVVAVGRRVLPKADTEEEARACLGLLSGRAHRVYTAVVLVPPSGHRRERLVETRLRFKRLSRQEIEGYIRCGEWRGKAGGYAIQGRAAAFILALAGSYTAVVGLPLQETCALLSGEGYPVLEAWGATEGRG